MRPSQHSITDFSKKISPNTTHRHLSSFLKIYELSKTISNNNTQNTRLIRRLGNATGKGFNTHSTSSPTTGTKKSFLQMGF
jgi:hypothetical protein